jgi:arylsulfatase A-like enzyme
VQDVLARLDVTIGELLDHLDRAVGEDHYVVALSADHGVATMPEHIRAEGGEAGRFTNREIQARAEEAISRHFGPGKYVSRALYTDLYLEPGVFKRLAANPEAMKSLLEAVATAPGVQRVFRGDELAGKEASADRIERAAALSYFPGRSGDIVLVPRTNWFIAGNITDHSTTHGTAHWYDARVPLILYGAGIRGGKYSQAASPADMVPTLAALCSFQLPGVHGRVLAEALQNHSTAGNDRQP